MTAFDKVTGALTNRVGPARNGQFRCPAHDDDTPSLSVATGNDGTVLVKCHAGCGTADVLAAVGLELRDLFAKEGSSGAEVVATYDYVDESGELLFQVQRLTPKSFRQRRPDGNGGWLWKVSGVRRVPYRLPEVLGAVSEGRWVLVVEGEKDVDRLEQWNVAATCNAGGAEKWRAEYAEHFRGAKVAVLPDHDDRGRAHARQVAESLHGVADVVKVLELPGLAEHGDVSSWIAAGGDRSELRQMVTEAPPWEPSEKSKADDVATTSWPPEDGAVVLDAVRAALDNYVVTPNVAAADACTLFIVATHCQSAWEHATRFVVKSPQKRCGKTRLLEVVAELVHRPMRTTNISVAALVRSIDENDPPTLVLDEADSVFSARRGERSESAEDLRGILNSGHSRGWPYRRWNVSSNKAEEHATFAMAILAGIGDWAPDTIEDRAVVISMRRRAPGEKVQQFRRRRSVPALRELHARIAQWALHLADELETAEPALPVEDRQADVWEPLVAVADAAGGSWPERARAACMALTGAIEPDDATVSERLLADLLDVFGDEKRLPTATILEKLAAIEEAPWGDWYGKPLAARGLARLLKPYSVRSRSIKLPDGTTPKGYRAEDLEDPWNRYLAGTRDPAATAATSPPSDETTPPAVQLLDLVGGGLVADSDSESATPQTSGNIGQSETGGGVAAVVDDPPDGDTDNYFEHLAPSSEVDQ